MAEKKQNETTESDPVEAAEVADAVTEAPAEDDAQAVCPR